MSTVTYIHPGQRAQPYLKPAVEYGRRIFKPFLNEIVGTVHSASELIEKLSEGVSAISLAVTSRARTTAPTRLGRLKNSIEDRQVSLFQHQVGTNVEYAEAVEKGVKPHQRTIQRRTVRRQ